MGQSVEQNVKHSFFRCGISQVCAGAPTLEKKSTHTDTIHKTREREYKMPYKEKIKETVKKNNENYNCMWYTHKLSSE